MPARSRSQFRFMKAVEKGDIKVPGLSKKEAKEFTEGNKNLEKLPEKVKNDRYKKLKKVMK